MCKWTRVWNEKKKLKTKIHAVDMHDMNIAYLSWPFSIRIPRQTLTHRVYTFFVFLINYVKYFIADCHEFTPTTIFSFLFLCPSTVSLPRAFHIVFPCLLVSLLVVWHNESKNFNRNVVVFWVSIWTRPLYVDTLFIFIISKSKYRFRDWGVREYLTLLHVRT